MLSSAQQDLIIRVTQAYFDVLLARFNIELTESQKAAVSENLAQAKRNFEVGTATITDTNDAQAKYDQIVAQEIAARTDLDNKVAALRAILGRLPRDLRRFGGRFDPQLPSPNALEPWIEQALRQNLQVRIAQANFDIATLEVDRQRAAPLPDGRPGRELQPGLRRRVGVDVAGLVGRVRFAAGADRCAAQRAALPGRRDRLPRAAGDRQPGPGPPGSRIGATQRAAPRADIILRA